MKIDINIIKIVLANKIQQCVKRIIYHDQERFLSVVPGLFNIRRAKNVIQHINRLKKKKEEKSHHIN